MSMKFANYLAALAAFVLLIWAGVLTYDGATMAMEEVTPRGLVILAAAAGSFAASASALLAVRQVTVQGLAPLLNMGIRLYGMLSLALLLWALLLPNW